MVGSGDAARIGLTAPGERVAGAVLREPYSRTMRRLVRDGLLVQCRRQRAHHPAAVRRAICVATRDRSDAFERFLLNLPINDAPCVYVIDASRIRSHIRRNQRAVECYRDRGGIAVHVPTRLLDAWVSSLRVAKPEWARAYGFLLNSSSVANEAYGAALNACLLLLNGSHIHYFDDDIVPMTYRHRGSSLVARLCGEPDPTRLHVLKHNSDCSRFSETSRLSVVEAQARYLGASLTSLNPDVHTGEEPGVPPESIFALAKGTGRVVAALAGVQGDPGAWSTHSYALSRTDEIKEWVSACGSYRRMRRSRTVVRASNNVVIFRPYAYFMNAVMALDTSVALPPFLPVYRNMDGFYGRMLCALNPDWHSVVLPLLCPHVPTVPRERAEHPSAPAMVRVTEVMSYFLFRYRPKCHDATPLVVFADWMAALSSYPDQVWRRALEEAVHDVRVARIRALDATLHSAEEDGMTAWVRDLRRQRRALAEALCTKGEVQHESGRVLESEAVKNFMSLFAMACRTWGTTINDASISVVRFVRRHH